MRKLGARWHLPGYRCDDVQWLQNSLVEEVAKKAEALKGWLMQGRVSYKKVNFPSPECS